MIAIPALFTEDIGVSVKSVSDISIGLGHPFHISVNPMLASIAMIMSSLTVILNASRLRKIKL